MLSVTALTVGAIRSIMKLVLPIVLELPAASLAVALTLIVPSPNVTTSALLKTTACAAPVPVRVLVTVLAPLLKTTCSGDPARPVTVITPPA